jgi:hypothetical protein
MNNRTQKLMNELPGPILGLDPRSWDGPAFVSEVGEPSSSGWDVQLTYLDELALPQSGIAVHTLGDRTSFERNHAFPPDRLSGFVMRFNAELVLALGEGDGDSLFSKSDFEARLHQIQYSGHSIKGRWFRHTSWPLEILQLDVSSIRFLGAAEEVLIAGWKRNVTPLIDQLVMVDQSLAAHLQ